MCARPCLYRCGGWGKGTGKGSPCGDPRVLDGWGKASATTVTPQIPAGVLSSPRMEQAALHWLPGVLKGAQCQEHCCACLPSCLFLGRQEMPRAPPSSFNKHVQGLCQRHRPNEALCLVPTAFIVEGGASPCLHAHSAPQPIVMVQLTCPEQGNPVPQSQPMAPLGAFMTSYHLRGPRVHM